MTTPNSSPKKLKINVQRKRESQIIDKDASESQNPLLTAADYHPVSDHVDPSPLDLVQSLPQLNLTPNDNPFPYISLNTVPDYTNPKVASVRNLLGRTVKIVLKDQRILIGKLHCVDWSNNTIITETYQAHIQVQTDEKWYMMEKPPPGLYSIRHLGSVLIPKEIITEMYLAHYPEVNHEEITRNNETLQSKDGQDEVN